MVVAIGDIEPGAMPPTSAWWPRLATQNRMSRAGIVEHRRAHGDVGQMGAAVVGRVEHIDVAGPDVAGILADDGLDRAVHRAEMHRHVRRVGDQRAVAANTAQEKSSRSLMLTE